MSSNINNPKRGDWLLNSLYVKSGKDHELVKLELGGGKGSKEVQMLRGTPEHPFYVVGTGFVAMGELKPGMKVITRRGPPLVVGSVERELHPKGVTVYNFEVEDDHTYFVGTANGGVWVHNNDCIPLTGSTKQLMQNLDKRQQGAMGELAEENWRRWLIKQGVELEEKEGAFRGGPDAVRTGGEHLGWDWAELKPNTPTGQRDGGVEIRQRYRDGATGESALYVYDTEGGGAFVFQQKRLRKPRP